MTDALRLIPLSKLVPSPSNVRTTGMEADLDELTASIAAHGLLQNLTVRAVPKKNGRKSETFEAIAGGRRLLALRRLADRGTLPKRYLVPCRVLGEENPTEVSLAENAVRAPLHPADQFEAFLALSRDGLGIGDIAGRFGISPLLVEQRLKLAAVSPRLLAEYRAEAMNLDQLMAFAISDDHGAQERVWFDSPLHDRSPQAIRRALTNALVEGADRRARFVGASAYEAAGGVIIRDLFKGETEGYFADSELLDRLASEKLSAAAEAVRAEGWSWVEVLPALDHGYLARHGRLSPESVPLSAKDQKKLDRLSERYDRLIEECGDEPAPEFDAELGRIVSELDRLAEKSKTWPAEAKVAAGAVLALDFHGRLRIERGLVKPKNGRNGASAGGPESGSDAEPPEPRQPKLPDALMEDLTAHRTAALQAVLAQKPEVALTALLHTLVLKLFFNGGGGSCVKIKLTELDLTPFASGIGESRAAEALAAIRQKLAAEFPEEGQLWPWLESLDRRKKLALLAYCVATSVDAVSARFERGSKKPSQADLIAMATGLDMADWWQPTREAILGRISKAQILQAVGEAESQEAADALAGLKKDAMAERAEPILTGKRWLPEPLRTRRETEIAQQDGNNQ